MELLHLRRCECRDCHPQDCEAGYRMPFEVHGQRKHMRRTLRHDRIPSWIWHWGPRCKQPSQLATVHLHYVSVIEPPLPEKRPFDTTDTQRACLPAF